MFVIIIGGGRTGSQLGHMLLDQGHTIRLIEDRPEMLHRLHRELPTECIVEGNPANPTSLQWAKASEAQVLAACHNDDAINLAAAYVAREVFGIQRVIARINNPRTAWLFNQTFHVDVALSAADMMASLIQEQMSLGDMVTLLKLRKGRYSLVAEKVPTGARAVNIPLKDLKLPKNCVIAAVIRDGEVIIPTGELVFREEDEVLAVTDREGARRLSELLAETENGQ